MEYSKAVKAVRPTLKHNLKYELFQFFNSKLLNSTQDVKNMGYYLFKNKFLKLILENLEIKININTLPVNGLGEFSDVFRSIFHEKALIKFLHVRFWSKKELCSEKINNITNESFSITGTNKSANKSVKKKLQFVQHRCKRHLKRMSFHCLIILGLFVLTFQRYR